MNELAIKLPPSSGVVSPDANWLATTHTSFDSQYVELTIWSSDGQQYKTVQLEKKENEYFTLYGWQDNQHVLLNHEYIPPPLYSDPPETQTPYSYAILMLNPFTDEQREFAPDYPDMCGCGSSVYPYVFDKSYFVFDPFLELVVYPQLDSDGYHVTLWDIQRKQSVAQLADGYSLGHDPIWAQDGSYFVVPVTTWFAPKDPYNYEDDERVLEWFKVSREGKIEQLTHFYDTYHDIHINMRIGKASLSPNGRLLGFLQKTVDGVGVMPHVVVFNLETQNINHYCASEDGALAWSPDSRYLAVGDRDSMTANIRSIVVDSVEGWAALVAENAVPMGWMKSP